jgi:DNA-directed RNA polymerase subunit K/omega
MKLLPEGIDSVFRYIVITAQRAEQLIQSAKPRMESKHVKASLIAKDEVDADLVEWRVLTPEEVEARRQAVVDELKAEMAGPEGAVRDVLPTEPEPEEGSRDEELARLQKLFGMALAEEERRAAEQSGASDTDEEVEEVSLEEAVEEEEDGSGDDTDED